MDVFHMGYLPQLDEAVRQIVARPSFDGLVADLKGKLQHTPEPFVWSTLDLQGVTVQLPNNIRSCWIFVLKKDVPSGCHFHPNSIQHMVTIEGEGTAKVGNTSSQIRSLGDPNYSIDDVWHVIPEGVPHEFFPARADMVVVSFHTCESEELEEISCDSGASRNYEVRGAAPES